MQSSSVFVLTSAQIFERVFCLVFYISNEAMNHNRNLVDSFNTIFSVWFVLFQLGARQDLLGNRKEFACGTNIGIANQWLLVAQKLNSISMLRHLYRQFYFILLEYSAHIRIFEPMDYQLVFMTILNQ